MNGVILTLFTIFVVTIIAQSNYEESYTNGLREKYLKYYHNKKNDYMESYFEKLRCSGFSEKMKHADKIFSECIQKFDDNLTICETAKRFILNCTQPYLKIGENCFPEYAKELPHLLINALYSEIDYLCSQSGETILEFLNPCVWENRETLEMKNCTEKGMNLYNKYLEKLPSTNEVCSDITGLRTCYETLVAKCTNPISKRAHLGLYEALISPCSNISGHNINNRAKM